MSSMLKQAEKNVIKQAALLQETLDYIDALRNAFYKIFDSNAYNAEKTQQMFVEGLNLARQAVYAKYCENITRCFSLVGIGGEEVTEFCKQKAKERFNNDRLCIMSYLDKHGHMPSWIKTEDIEQLKQEIKDKLE